MLFKLSEIENLKIVYQEIIDGASYFSKESYFIKHLNDLDNITILKKRIEFFEQAVNNGLPTEAAKLKEVVANEEWEAGNEEKILSLRYIISDNEKNLLTLIPQQQAIIKKVLEDKRKELSELLIQRRQALGLTAEDSSEADSYHYITFISLYKDKSCQSPFFESWEEFESVDESEASKHSQNLQTMLSRFNEESIRKISVMPFFLNSFSYCKENIHTFLSKPMFQLTNYQMLLFSMGSRNINILSQANGEPPMLLGDTTPQQVLDWFDQNYSIILGKRNSS